ncbi:adenylate/guanylate cyclase domain-containing protein [Mesorhizobium onobrychidis]|uniref:ABC transporter substrate-binding protein n=1 Tax=Mesorhizobium onobrychidis TaxID=2775404 RepID=A0ABY5R1X7_9HYPH|nr:adenylate/guanylate cyclase domain-containing protein [Mesorhizobium onobrychidis]UVC17283.1 ABC transporter substrate-binding protein [Mesorhizobium onobrychidis]
MERRLAAVLFSDVVGYSKLMGTDEVGTHKLLKEIFSELIAPKTSQYRGRIIKFIGDGQLMEFPSVVDAVIFAVEIQMHMRQLNESKQEQDQIQFRIGINIGDVMIEPDDIYGDGVNLAARMESVATPGGICLSQSAYDQVSDKLALDVEDMGRLELKNIARPMHTYSILLNDKARAFITPVESLGAQRRKALHDIILIFHGSRSQAEWQTWIPEELRGEGTADIQSTSINFIGRLKFLIPGLSPSKQLGEIRQVISAVRATHPESAYKLSILAHGYATSAVTKILQENPHLAIDNLLLSRSVVHPKFNWDQVSSQIKGLVLNECATRDAWPLAVRSFNWRFGATGVFGFHSPRVKDRFHPVQYNQLLTKKFVKTFWAPFFYDSEIVQPPDSDRKIDFPAYFWWLGAPLKVALGTFVGITLLLAGGIAQFLANDFSFNSNNIICRCLRVVATPPNDVDIGALAWFEKDSGALSKWAIQRSVDHAKSSERYTFEPNVLLRDYKGTREAVEEALNEFRASNVVAVVGPMTSELAYYAKKWGNVHKTPVITANASAAYLTQEGVADYFFRVSMSDAARVEALVDWMVGNKRDLSPYIIHEWKALGSSADEPESYGMQQASVAIRHMPETALETTTIRYTRGDKRSMEEAVQRVFNDAGRPIAIFGYTDDIVYIIANLHKRGVTNDIYLTGTYNKKIAEAGFPYADKVHVVSDVVSEEGYATQMADFKVEYDNDSKKPPNLDYDVVAAYAYDATSIVLDAIQEAVNNSCLGYVNGRLVAEHLRRTPPRQRKIVNTTFLHNRQEVFIPLARYKIGTDNRLVRGID